MKTYFPPKETLINLEPEEIAQYILVYLNIKSDEQKNKFHRYNLFNNGNNAVIEYAGTYPSSTPVLEAIVEGWQWLLKEGFLVPRNDEQSSDWVCLSRRGRQVKKIEDFPKFAPISYIPNKGVDEKLYKKVIGIYIRGDYETAVFSAFKELEIRIRKSAELNNKDFGNKLIEKTFDPKKGILIDQDLTYIEKLRFFELISGAMGTFRNPPGHREVDYDSPLIAASLILFANTLIKTVENLEVKYKKRKSEVLKLQASI